MEKKAAEFEAGILANKQLTSALDWEHYREAFLGRGKDGKLDEKGHALWEKKELGWQTAAVSSALDFVNEWRGK